MRRLLLASLLLLGGCVYYNGVYNAERLAGRARKAEREGRTLEANGLWGQVAVRADTVLARHPRSKYTAQVNLLQGTAYAHLKDCGRALSPLQRVATLTTRPDLVEESSVILGQCYLTLGDPSQAAELYASLTSSTDPVRRNLALFEHGRALSAQGDFSAALVELSRSTHPAARGERAAALAGLGRTEELGPVVDSLLVARDSLAPWSDIVALLAVREPAASAALTDRLAEAEQLSPSLRARVLIADGQRLSASDTGRAEARFAAAERLARGTPAIQEARFARSRSHVLNSESAAVLSAELDPLDELSSGSGPVAPRAGVINSQLRRLVAITDSVPPGAPQGDLRLFLGGELARDSLGALAYARHLFRRVEGDWPASPFAAKALLALISLDTLAADSLRGVLRTRYPGSPYLLLVQGADPPEYRTLEDSLRRYALGFRPGGTRRPAVTPGRPAPAGTQPATPKRPDPQ